MDKKIKLLISGDVRGHFKQLFQRVESINKKAGPFEILLCVGDFFGASNDELIAYRNGAKHIPVPTYILGPNCKEHEEFYADAENGEICPNLTYLGKRGLYTTTAGIKIIYLSGVEAAPTAGDARINNADYNFNKEDIAAIRNMCVVSNKASADYKGVDILITSQWPAGILEDAPNTSKLISFLCKEIKPRYHFCGMNGRYHEPPPFRIPADQMTIYQLCTRFISLAEVGNVAKEKYIYALSLMPVEKMRVMELIQKTTDETVCPYVNLDLSDCAVAKEGGSFENRQFFYDMSTRNDGNRKRVGRNNNHAANKRPRIMDINQEKCWFCLSSPDVEKHLVISIGSSFYLALAKGPINEYHVLILSINHIPASSFLTPDDWEELLRFKTALRKCFKSLNKIVCFTERHYQSCHLQINAFALDNGYTQKLSDTFSDKAEEYGVELNVLPPLKTLDMLPERRPYFVAELPDERTLLITQMKKFSLHFAREVICSENVLNADEKIDWRDCKLEKDEEIEMVKEFRKTFAKYDFTL